MAITLPSGFKITSKDPIDTRITVANQTARLGFSPNNIYNGLVVFQRDTNELYVLDDTGSYNSNSGWSIVGGGGGTPASPANSIQFNNGGTFGGDPRFVFNPNSGLAQISGSLHITSSVSSDVFIVNDGTTDLFKIQNDGVLIFTDQPTLPTAAKGGMVYSGSAFYIGIE